jgi:hypothetical protein
MTVSRRKGQEEPVKLKTKAQIAGLAAVAVCASAGGHRAAAAPSAPVLMSVSGNVAVGETKAAEFGYTGGEWSCLYDLWQRESGWQDDIQNPQSGAFGIAQALGHGAPGASAVDAEVRYPDGSTASDVTVDEYPSYAANAENADAQIEWGLTYISSTYGDPCAAWGHEEADGWY